MSRHYPDRQIYAPHGLAIYWLDKAHILEFRAHTKPGNNFESLMAEARMCREKSRRIAAQQHQQVERAA